LDKETDTNAETYFANLMAIAREYDAVLVMEPEDLCLACMDKMQDWEIAIVTPYKANHEGKTYTSVIALLCSPCRRKMPDAMGNIISHLDANKALRFGGA
jgi:hypothetical protein